MVSLRYECAKQDFEQTVARFLDNGGGPFCQYDAWVQERPGSNCFIVTAATGSPGSREVMVLAGWRDRVLAKSRLGRLAIAVYGAVGPWIAAILNRGTRRRILVRDYVVRPIAGLVESWEYHPE